MFLSALGKRGGKKKKTRNNPESMDKSKPSAPSEFLEFPSE